MTIRPTATPRERDLRRPDLLRPRRQRFREKVRHPDNVFWPQALAANKVYQLLYDKQQAKAKVAHAPQGRRGRLPGPAQASSPASPSPNCPMTRTRSCKRRWQLLLEPYRKEDQDETLECMKKQGGLDKCYLGFYKDGRGEETGSDEKNYDNWRLEGPLFVWYFRGTPHVHVWVNIADDPSIETNAKG